MPEAGRYLEDLPEFDYGLEKRGEHYLIGIWPENPEEADHVALLVDTIDALLEKQATAVGDMENCFFISIEGEKLREKVDTARLD